MRSLWTTIFSFIFRVYWPICKTLKVNSSGSEHRLYLRCSERLLQSGSTSIVSLDTRFHTNGGTLLFLVDLCDISPYLINMGSWGLYLQRFALQPFCAYVGGRARTLRSHLRTHVRTWRRLTNYDARNFANQWARLCHVSSLGGHFTLT